MRTNYLLFPAICSAIALIVAGDIFLYFRFRARGRPVFANLFLLTFTGAFGPVAVVFASILLDIILFDYGYDGRYVTKWVFSNAAIVFVGVLPGIALGLLAARQSEPECFGQERSNAADFDDRMVGPRRTTGLPTEIQR